eukprot:1324770-Pleurochrysis_carterae.AAC.1
MGASSARSHDANTSFGQPLPPLPDATHVYERLPGKRGRSCSYCDKKAYQFCARCADRGLGTMFAC